MQLPESVLVKKQVKTYEKIFKENNINHRIVCNVRYDDECGNCHNSFSITGTIYSDESSSNERYFVTGGCIHEDISKHFPELKHLVKWHSTNSDGPLYYVDNTTYHARDREHKGKEIGEAVAWDEQLKFEGYPFTFKEPRTGFFKYLQSVNNWKYEDLGFIMRDVEILEVLHTLNPKTYSANYTFSNYPDSNDWYKAPFRTKNEASEFLEALQTLKFEIVKIPTKWNKAVEPNLEAARSCAVWPDATLEQLQNKEALMERLPALMQEFKKDIEALGFIY